jgi:hypothetical protein
MLCGLARLDPGRVGYRARRAQVEHEVVRLDEAARKQAAIMSPSAMILRLSIFYSSVCADITSLPLFDTRSRRRNCREVPNIV